MNRECSSLNRMSLEVELKTVWEHKLKIYYLNKISNIFQKYFLNLSHNSWIWCLDYKYNVYELLYMYTVRCTLYTVHCKLFTVHRILHTVNCTLYTVNFTCTLYTLRSTLYTLHRTPYTARCSTLYTTRQDNLI